jgi:hypothetical protein
MKIAPKFITVVLISALSASLVLAQGGGGRQRGRGGNQYSELTLLNRKDVQKDLALTDDQVTKLDEYRTKNTPQRGAGGGGAGGGQRGGGAGAGGGAAVTDEQRAAMVKAAAERREKTRKDLLEIVSEAQLKRVDEIAIQLQGSGVMTNAEIQKVIGLSDDQIAKIKDLQAKQREANMALGQKMRDQEITREDFTAAMTKNNDTMKEELGKILTSAQADKLKTMGGKPFTADAPGN